MSIFQFLPLKIRIKNSKFGMAKIKFPQRFEPCTMYCIAHELKCNWLFSQSCGDISIYGDFSDVSVRPDGQDWFVRKCSRLVPATSVSTKASVLFLANTPSSASAGKVKLILPFFTIGTRKTLEFYRSRIQKCLIHSNFSILAKFGEFWNSSHFKQCWIDSILTFSEGSYCKYVITLLRNN